MRNYKPKTTGACEGGCVCKNGYVFDEISKDCVSPSLCSCKENGKNYNHGDHVKNGCNDCICQGGEWYCKNRCQMNNDDNDDTYGEDAIVDGDDDDASARSEPNNDPNSNKNSDPNNDSDPNKTKNSDSPEKRTNEPRALEPKQSEIT